MQVFSRFVRLEATISKMMPSALASASSTITSLACESARHLLDAHPRVGALRGSALSSTSNTITSLACESARHLLDAHPRVGALRGLSHFISSEPTTLKGGISIFSHRWQEMNTHEKGRAFCTNSNNVESNYPQDNQAPPQQQPPQGTYEDMEPDRYEQMSPTMRRRPYNLEAKMRMKAYRREAMQRMRTQEIEDEERNFQLDYSSIYQKGAPGTVQGVVRDIISVGYFVTLPNGREGFLPSAQLGCSGGIPLLTRLFKVGDEITVRAVVVGDGGRDRLYVKP